MDDFTPYGNEFDEALDNFEKVLVQSITTRLCLNNEKFHMLMIEGVVLEHFIYTTCIQINLDKIEVILKLLVPHTPRKARIIFIYVR